MLILWLKAFHVIFMVAWFAGIFYFPRLLVYHAQSKEKLVHDQLKIMERRLLYFVTPFAVLTAVFGIALIYQYGREWFKLSGWLHAKLTLVILLYLYHGYCFKLLAEFKQDKNKRSARFYRWFNEFPVILLFAIIILAVVKPF
ncbi:protoporphyrinogen oxidase HemJ [Catenovulum sp. 2E275]|uniref:protoporphyrinogen oxidase HemJ n=1 Tax=Catenovulum sp. 2E275 TaxID=2980497 RepID=UPI0021CF6165|nr:protoporphyrinogen oxidase HemJ [Catenovulum sp. 2E275]MCU4676047.1 protoporphyrinogen oxidase HemJ [Catenovulum sp. 2E275]